MLTEGLAYLDGSGRVLAADASFRAALGLPAGDASSALLERARSIAALAALVAGEGPDRASIPAIGSLPACEVTRVSGEDGMLLRVAVRRDAAAVPAAELAMQAITLARLAGSVAHEVKNPLNAMALQLALLGDKIASTSDSLAASCVGNLASLKNQIGRINEVIRRYVEIADAPPSAGFDAAGLVADAASLFGHEARRRRIALVCEAPEPGTVRAVGDGGRAARLLLGLFWRAIGSTPAGERLVARVSLAGAEVVLSLEHPLGDPDPSLAWIPAVVSAGVEEMGGRLEESRAEGVARVAVVLSKESAP